MKHLKAEREELEALFFGKNVFLVPLFQRSYKWDARTLGPCFDDLLELHEGTQTSRFLGPIVITEEGRREGAAEHWIIDGQQRLTTLYLLLVAIVDQLFDLNASEVANEIVQENLVISRRGGATRPRLRPALLDTRQMNAILGDLRVEGLVLPTPQGRATGLMANGYRVIQKLLQRSMKDLDRSVRAKWLEDFSDRILEGVSFVTIVLGDDEDASEVFDRLNTMKLELAVPDLVRNEVMKVVSDWDNSLSLYEKYWIPFEESFADAKHFEKYFFPFALADDSRITKSTTFKAVRSGIKTSREGISDKKHDAQIKVAVEHIATYRDIYLALTGKGDVKRRDISCWGATLSKAEKKELARRIGRFVRFSPSIVVFPYLLKLIKETAEGRVPVDEACACLDVVESFLVRRALVGREPTGLHAVFKGLWREGDFETASLRDRLTTRTIDFPTDDQLRMAISDDPLYGKACCRYVLWELELDIQHGDKIPVSNYDLFQVDHLVPQSPGPQSVMKKWGWTKASHSRLRDTWANLVPLTPEGNQQKWNLEWSKARNLMKGKTMFKSTSQVYEAYPEWTPAEVAQRSIDMVEFAQRRWPK